MCFHTFVHCEAILRDISNWTSHHDSG